MLAESVRPSPPRLRHDAYLIYRMLGREVAFNGRQGTSRKVVTGVVSNIYRDVLNRSIEVVVNGRNYKFPEPAAITMSGGYMIFVYGSRKKPDLSDEALFREMKSTEYRDNIDDILHNTPSECKTVKFCLGRKPSEIKPAKALFPATV